MAFGKGFNIELSSLSDSPRSDNWMITKNDSYRTPSRDRRAEVEGNRFNEVKNAYEKIPSFNFS